MANRDVMKLESILEKTVGCGDDIDQAVRTELEAALSPARLRTSFIDDSHTISTESPAINFKEMRKTFAKLGSQETALKLVASIIQHQYQDLGATLCQSSSEDLSSLRAVPILLACPAFGKPDKTWSRTIIVNMAKTFLHLKREFTQMFKVLEHWLSNEQSLLARTVRVFRGGLVGYMTSKADDELGTLDSYKDVLNLLGQINEDHRCPVPRRRFYIDELEADLMAKLMHIRLQLRLGVKLPQLFPWLSVPCVLNVKTKWRLVTLETEIIQNTRTVQVSPRHSLSDLYFQVDRAKIFQSTIENVDRYWNSPNDFWLNPLVVDFKGEDILSSYNRERVIKDFFQCFIEALVNSPNISFFKKINEQNVSSPIWFDESNMDRPTLGKIGHLFALLIYNGAVVTVPFPLLLYEKLLTPSSPPAPDDLKRFDPEYVERLYKLRECTEDELEALYLDFEGLQPDGEYVDVTRDNLEQYIAAKSMTRLAPDQFVAFARGFDRICSMTPLLRTLFKPDELRNVILGEEFDWTAFEKSAVYERPFEKEHPVVKMFWKVFHDIEERDKRKFLKVLTGADHAPIEGFRSLRFWVRRLENTAAKYSDPADPDRHPQPGDLCPEIPICPDHIMYLPEYQTEEDVRFRLLMLLQIDKRA